VNGESWFVNREQILSMKPFPYLRSLGARFFRGARVDREMEEEFRAHVQLHAERLERSGMDRVEAERQARIRFGSNARFKEECREALGGNGIDNLMQDARFSLRTLRKSPGFFAVAVITLALGIGATVAAFSVVNAVLLRPFAFRDPQSLLWIYSQRPDNARTNFSLPEYCDYRDQNRSFDDLAAVASYNPTFSDSGQAERVQGVRLSANAFGVLGVRPLLGRTLVEADDRSGAPAVALISYGLWSRHYGKSENVIGRSANLNGEMREIVGVLPRNFVLPNLDTDIVVPLQPDSDSRRNVRNSVNFLRMFGRLKASVTAKQAHAELDSIRQNLHRQFPDAYTGKVGITIVPLTEEIVANIKAVLLTTFCAAGAVLLIGCTNLAGMSLARAGARQRELAMRAALGASRKQLVRLLLAESAILAVIAGTLGVYLEMIGRDAFLRLVPTDLPRIDSFSIDWTVVVFAIVSTLIAALACGLAPALLLSRADLRDALVTGGRSSTAITRRLRTWLVSGQIALALVLLANAGLLFRSFVRLSREQPGFDSANVLTVRFSLPQTSYPDRDSIVQFYEKLQPPLAALPEVRSVGLVSILPLAPKSISFIHFTRPDKPPATREETPSANYRIVSPDYFRAIGIPLVSGRYFTDEDDGERPPVVLISVVLATKYFSDRSPLGQRITIDDTDGDPRQVEIVGVVGAVKQSNLETPPQSDLYLPLRQVPKDGVPWLRNSAYWVLKTSAGAAAVEPALRAAIRRVDANVGVGNLRPMTEVMAAAVAARRFSLLLIGSFAGAALFLAAAGLYAVISYGIQQRTREIGVRLALGATRGNILRMIFREGAMLLSVGIVSGLVVAMLLAQFIANQMFGVSARDALSFAAVSVLLSGVSLLACWIAARRALKVDPVVALRSE
jgi:predicted permease